MRLGRMLAKDTLNYGLGQVMPKVIGFLLIPLYTAYLSPADFGVFDLAITLSSLLLVTMRLSVPGAITRFYYDYCKSPREQDYITSIYWFVLFVSLVTGLLSLLVGFFFIEWLVPGLPFYPFVVLIVISSFFNSGSEIQKKLLQVRQQSGYSSWLNIFTALLTILLSVIFVVYWDLKALGLVLATVITSFILFVQAQYYLHSDLGGKVDKKLIRESAGFSLVLFPYHLYGHISTMVTRSILAGYGSLSAVGILAIATKFTQPFTIVINAFSAAFTPQYLSVRAMGTDDNNHQLGLLINRIWFGSCFLFIAFFLFSDVLIFTMTSESYEGAASVTKLLACGFLPQMFYIIFANELFYRKENKILLLINMVGITSSLLLSWILVRKYDQLGAAIATVAPSVVGAILIFFFTRRKLSFNPPWTFIAGSLAVVLFVIGVDLWVTSVVESPVFLFSTKVVLVGILISGCFLIDRKTFDDLGSVLRRKK